ncbi:MAG: thioesterase family protein [Bacteroidota bacterium]
MDHQSKLIARYPEIEITQVRISSTVHWGDMDIANHVNNINYLRWCETARVGYFERAGIDTKFSTGVGAILGWQDAKYLYPMAYPDEALITAQCLEIREDRFVMECRVYSLNHTRLAVISKQQIVPYDYDHRKKAPLPYSWISGIKALEPAI